MATTLYAFFCADDVGFTGDLSEKKGILKLEPGESFDAEYRIEIAL